MRLPRLPGANRGPLPSWPLLVVALVAVSAFAYGPLLHGGLVVTGDTSHAFRIYEMHRCLRDGQLPCRWVPDLGNGYGYPLFNYYPPLPYYGGELLHRIGLSYVRSVNVLFAVGLTGAALSMFALGRRLWGGLGGLVSASAYVFAPYLALDVYLRGALDELWALAIAPALLWALYELITTARPRYVPMAALLGALLLLSHNLVAVIMAPAIALWIAALLALRGREAWKAAGLCAIAGAWGLGLAAFFTLPALHEGGYVQLDSLSAGPFHYSHHFVSPGDLFLLRTGDYSYLLGGRSGTPVQIGWFHWGLAGIAVAGAVALWRWGRRREAILIVVFGIFFFIGAFMSTAASRAIWDHFHSLRFLQFPWRYIGLASLAAAALAGVPVALLRGRPLLWRAGTAVVLAGLFVGSGRLFEHAVYRCDVSDSEVVHGTLHGRPIPDPVCSALFSHPEDAAITDYLPKAVAEIPKPPDAPARVVGGSAHIVSAEKGSDWLKMKVEAETAARIEAALFDYPNWRVRVDGRAVAHEAGAPNGLVTFHVAAGSHRVEVRLEDTGVRRLGNALSLVSWAGLLLAPAGGLAWRRFHDSRARRPSGEAGR